MTDFFIQPQQTSPMHLPPSARSKKLNLYLMIYRTRMRLSKTDLARLVSADPKTIYNIENGKVLPNVVLAIKIARVLGVTVEDIFKIR